MKATIDLYDFREAFKRMGRDSQFSYEALELLYDYLEECDPDWELDVIAICCDFQELSREEFCEQYDVDMPEDQEDEDYEGDLTMAIEDYASRYLNFIGWTSGHESIVVGE